MSLKSDSKIYKSAALRPIHQGCIRPRASPLRIDGEGGRDRGHGEYLSSLINPSHSSVC